MGLIDAIRARRSVRTFDGTSLDPALLGELNDYAGSLENPFHIPIEFRMLDADEHGLSSPVILGARTYVAAKVVRQPHAEEAFGYAFERLILHATSLGLGTVWLAGTIDRPAFERAMEVGEDEVMPAVSPIGHAAPKRSVRESAMRRALRSDGRMAFGELFFENDFSSPLSMNEAGAWATPLQMVSLAPSATNKQPWRIVVRDRSAHLYERRAKGYARESTGDIQKVDLGIAMCHLALAASEAHMRGSFELSDPGIAAPADTVYIATYTLAG